MIYNDFDLRWLKIDKNGSFDAEIYPEFLLQDEYGFVYVGSTCFDYYEAKYWFPLPLLPEDI